MLNYEVETHVSRYCGIRPIIQFVKGSGLRPWKWTFSFDWLWFYVALRKVVAK